MRRIAKFVWLVWMFTWSTGAQVLYDVVPIPAPVGSEAYSWVGLDINNAGEVAGAYSAYMPDGIRNHIVGFIYSDGMGTRELTVEGKRGSMATGINDAGQVALSTAEDDGTWRAMYRYTPGTGLQPLGTFGGRESETMRINASGQITGYSELLGQGSAAFRDTPGEGLENLGSLFGGGSTGYDINDAGWVVGASDGQNAFLFRDGEGMTFIAPGVARGINNAGTVVGVANVLGGRQAFIYENGEFRLLDATRPDSYALDINSSGTIVGADILTAVIWSEGGEAQDLNSLIAPDSGWSFLTANAINDHGQITGQGIFYDEIMAYRLDPIPEPSTWGLLGLSAAIWGLWRKRWGKAAPRC